MDQKIKVIYIMGWGRSGSTILSSILGQMDGFLQVGEIRTIWSDGFDQNRICGCGKPFLECDFWTRVFKDFSRRVETVQAKQWNRFCQDETRSLSAPKHLLSRWILPAHSHTPRISIDHGEAVRIHST